jgi:hypothetical protein
MCTVHGLVMVPNVSVNEVHSLTEAWRNLDSNCQNIKKIILLVSGQAYLFKNFLRKAKNLKLNITDV